MRIECPIHGVSEAIQLSPDYEPCNHAFFKSTAKWTGFDYLGESVDRYYLSQAFMDINKVSEGQNPLPDDYPEWISLIKIDCKKCFDERSATVGGSTGRRPAEVPDSHF